MPLVLRIASNSRRFASVLLAIVASAVVTETFGQSSTNGRHGEPAVLETVEGKTLSMLRTDEEVIVRQGDRVVMRYRYGGVAKPYVAQMTSPGGVQFLRDTPADHEHHPGLMFACKVDGDDFWGEGEEFGRQTHENFTLRIDSNGPVERAVIEEMLVWETSLGDYILEENRVLTVPAPMPGKPQMLVWQSNVTAGEDAIGPVKLEGAAYHGLGATLIAGGSGVAHTNGIKSPWCAVAAEVDGRPITVAMFDAPSNPGHPNPWCTKTWCTKADDESLAYLSATLGLSSKPLVVDIGKTTSLRFGIAAFDGRVGPGPANAAFMDWYQLQATAKSGLARGLIGRYFEGSGKPPVVARIDPGVAFSFDGGMPDDRLALGPFSASWQGQVFVDREGEYRFGSQTNGAARIWIGNEEVFNSQNPHNAESITLDYGYHPIRMAYATRGGGPSSEPSDAPAVNLIWESNHFAPEIINPRYLMHDAADEAEVAMALLHAPGRAKVDRLGCAQCHQIAGAPAGRRPGPPLGLSSQADRRYLTRWLSDPQSQRPGTPMPAMGGKPEEIKAAVPAMVAYLKSLKPTNEIVPIENAADRKREVDKGRKRFHELGCAACHSPEAPDDIDPALAPTLADVGAKWPEAVIRAFLAEPLVWHPEGGMPDFKLTRGDANRLAAYLSTFNNSEEPKKSDKPGEQTPSDPALVARGKQLIEQHRCAGCHDIPGVERAEPVGKLGPGSDLGGGCMRSERAASGAPLFRIELGDRVAVAEFLARRPKEPSPPAGGELAERTINEQFACFQCHARNGAGGVQLSKARLRFAGQEKTANADAMTAPDISGVGARLKRDWMLKVLAGEAPSARPWLTIRMPSFGLTDGERTAIADRLARADAMPHLSTPRPRSLPVEIGPTAGQLLSGAGFSCLNCHFIGKTRSGGESLAPDMTMISRRVDRDWYYRWLLNPARVLPGTTMPAHNLPARDIAGEDLLVQKEVIWQFLRRTSAKEMQKFFGSSATAVSVDGRRPQVVHGRVEGFAKTIRGVAIGFRNRRTIIFDYDRMAWRAMWNSGFVEETGAGGRHGAQHWWAPIGTKSWVSSDKSPPILYREKATGRWVGPALWRDRFGFLDQVTQIGRAVKLEYRLRAPGPRTGTYEPQAWVHLIETIQPNPQQPNPQDAEPGIMRTIEISGVPKEYDVVVQQPFGGIELGDSARAATGATLSAVPMLTGGTWVLRVSGDAAAKWIAPPESITYPVEQPFSDDLPMDPKKRFDPVTTPGKDRAAVLVPNTGEPIRMVWQMGEAPAGKTIVAGGPKLWAKPPEHVEMNDLGDPTYITEPITVDELPRSKRLSVPPGFKVERLPLPDDFLVCGLYFWKGKLLAGGYDGEIRWVDDTDGDGLPDRYRYCGGLFQQVNNLRVYDGELYATSPAALYRLRDLNGDEVIDEYKVLSTLWDYASHSNDWFHGITRDREGNLYGSNSTAYIYRAGGNPPGVYHRGDVLKITPDGRTLKVGTGTRFQFGWTENREGRMYFNINQGHYNYTCGIHEVTEGAHYGFMENDLSKVQKPVVRVPYPWCNSLNGMDLAESRTPFGPFQGQGFSADYNTNQVIRWTDYPIAGKRQGACYRFFTGTEAGPTEIVFGPDGALWVAFMSDAGWYGGRARGGIYKITYEGRPPLAVSRARVIKDGFALEMTEPVDPMSVTPDICRKVHRWWHENQGTYASPEIAHEDVAVHEVKLADDGRTILLRTDPHVTPRLYRIELKGLKTKDGRALADGLAFLTVHWAPQ